MTTLTAIASAAGCQRILRWRGRRIGIVCGGLLAGRARIERDQGVGMSKEIEGAQQVAGAVI